MLTKASGVSQKVGSIDLVPFNQVVIEAELKDTPMAGQSGSFIDAGKEYDIDPLFLAAVGYHESHYAKAYSKEANDKSHSYAGVMTFTSRGRELKKYNSWREAIFDHARVIKTGYLDQGLTTIQQIWLKYAPPIELTNDSWGPSVARKYIELKNYLESL